MFIEEKSLTHWINSFYGYGSWQARFWFVAFEESGGDVPEDVAERTTYFATTFPGHDATLCDIREIYRHVHARMDGPRADKFFTLFDHRFGAEAVLHGGWKNLIAFTHGCDTKKLPDLLSYQKKYFVSPATCKEALIMLYPLPAPHNHAWYYSWLLMPGLDFIRNRLQYQKTVYESRITTILNNMVAHKPEVVLMYGMNNINILKKSIQRLFPSAIFKTGNAIKQHTPQYHRTDLNGTRVLITTQVPTLRHNRIESGFDWYAFGESL